VLGHSSAEHCGALLSSNTLWIVVRGVGVNVFIQPAKTLSHSSFIQYI
jgi:hypothetical protein